jgi:hypothetical protein
MVSATKKQGWNVYKQIFSDHWGEFKRRYSKYDDQYYDELVEKMLSCGDPAQIGYVEYMCFECGECKRVVSMSCKCTLCLRCGNVKADDWVEKVSEKLHEGVIYRHIVLTVPADYRSTFYNQSEKLLDGLLLCGTKCLDDFFSFVSGKKVKGGYIVVLQTHGRNGQYNPHLHILATSGGLCEEEEEQEWVNLNYLPYPVLHKKWQWYLLEMLREEIDTEEIEQKIDASYKKYPKGFVANVQKGEVPERVNSLARYLVKYVVSPPISVRRIDRYDGGKVKYHYKSHRTERVETEEVGVYTFIGRMIQHVLPKGFKRIRYYGVQATKTYEKFKKIIQDALCKVKEVIKGAVKIISPKRYRERYLEGMGKDPFICTHCGQEMEVSIIWHPKYGVIYDEFKVIESGKYEQKEEENNRDKCNERAVRPTTEGIQLSLFGVRNRAFS